MKKIFAVTLLSSLITFPVWAVESLPDLGISTVDQLIDRIYRVGNVVFTILILFATGMILYAGFTYMTAAGKDEKVKEANKMIIYAAIGVLAAVFAKAIPLVVKNIVQ